jgi:hypothetical protein
MGRVEEVGTIGKHGESEAKKGSAIGFLEESNMYLVFQVERRSGMLCVATEELDMLLSDQIVARIRSASLTWMTGMRISPTF